MRKPMLVKHFMTRKVFTLSPEMDILRAVHILMEKNISGAPVLNGHGRLAGILTERDCLQIALNAGYHGMPGGPVRNFMKVDAQSVSPEVTIMEMAKMFIEQRYHRYPVLDNGRLVGIISRRDVMRAIGEHYPEN